MRERVRAGTSLALSNRRPSVVCGGACRQAAACSPLAPRARPRDVHTTEAPLSFFRGAIPLFLSLAIHLSEFVQRERNYWRSKRSCVSVLQLGGSSGSTTASSLSTSVRRFGSSEQPLHTSESRVELQPIVPSSTSPRPLVSMEMLGRSIMPQPSPQWSDLPKTIAKEWGVFGVRANTVAYGLVHTRLTASKEDGATIEIEGKKVALGIPAAQARVAESVNAYADIPLHRGATPDEAAAAMLFLTSPLASYVSGHTLEVTGGRGI